MIIDLTGARTVDRAAMELLYEATTVIRLRGAEPVIVGIDPDVAFELARAGLSFPGVETALNLEEGPAVLQRKLLHRSSRNGGARGNVK